MRRNNTAFWDEEQDFKHLSQNPSRGNCDTCNVHTVPVCRILSELSGWLAISVLIRVNCLGG